MYPLGHNVSEMSSMGTTNGLLLLVVVGLVDDADARKRRQVAPAVGVTNDRVRAREKKIAII
jgi:hypothetical protein